VEPGRAEDLVEAARAAGTPVTEVSAAVLAAMAETVTPQGVLGVAPLLDVGLDVALAGSPRLVAVLDQVNDPGNAGTVLRTADAAGADAVILAGDSVDPYNGKAVRASAGSLFHLPVVRGADLPAALEAARQAGLTVLAADGAGEADLDELAETGGLAAPTAWLFGNEAWGLPDTVGALADVRVRIPISARAESLNLAAAAAVCLFASARAYRHTGACSGASHPARAMP
jgi:TrmH family RNA methyltransferase